MKKLSILGLTLVCLLDLTSCQSERYVPPSVTAGMVRSTRRRTADLATLREGRSLFVHRCIECHTLPPFWRYKADDWPGLVDSMRDRAHLKPGDRDAIIAYILAARRK